MTPSGPTRRFSPDQLLAVLALVFFMVAGAAMLRTSVTFDEIVFPAVGARGLHTGDFTIVNDHPRLVQYLYGLPVYAMGVNYPAEQGQWIPTSRYQYARVMLWSSGNHAERIIAITRLVALFLGMLTVVATCLAGRRWVGPWPALAAAALLAFMPDMLAHSGVAYNDVPLALALVLSVYALDAAVRDPSAGRVALAALACALSVCLKYSAVVLGPILIVLLAMEALSGRWRDAAWRRRVAIAVPVFALVAYLTIALIYLGDWGLRDFIAGLRELTDTSLAGRVAFLLGERKVGGWWYFFPVAFLLKTPVALHALIVVSIAGAWWAGTGANWRALFAHSARAPAAAAAIYLAALLAAHVNIGLRHALPMMPFVCILLASGLAAAWQRSPRAPRVAIAVLFAGYAASTLFQFPWFLSYVSEYARGRPLYETLVDSNTDWGQGLLALRDFMRERGIDQVRLGYFGSAPPEAYGIDYVPLPSFFPLLGGHAGHPRYLVVSATLLTGIGLDGDPYARLRAEKPIAVVGGSMYVFDTAGMGKQ